MFKMILKFIYCDLLHKHKYDNIMSSSLYSEGWDEWYECRYCGKKKSIFMK